MTSTQRCYANEFRSTIVHEQRACSSCMLLSTVQCFTCRCGFDGARALWATMAMPEVGKRAINLLKPSHSQEPRQRCTSLGQFIYRELTSLASSIEMTLNSILPPLNHAYQGGRRLVSPNLHSSLVAFTGRLGSLASHS